MTKTMKTKKRKCPKCRSELVLESFTPMRGIEFWFAHCNGCGHEWSIRKPLAKGTRQQEGALQNASRQTAGDCER
jgi:hypothetical protein